MFTIDKMEKLRKRRRKRIKKAGHYLVRKSNHVFKNHSLISNEPVLDKALFSWISELENNWLLVRNELDGVLEYRDKLPAFHELSMGQKRISTGDNWKAFVLYVLGDRYTPNCDRCPQTARLLERIPMLRNAWFSILAPHYHIPLHEGPTKGLIRVHLGLKIPVHSENCRIKIGNETLVWQEGKCIVFDDSYEHEVWNDTDEERVVLFLDVDRPMRLPGRLLHKFLVALGKRTVFVQEVHQNLQSHEQQHRIDKHHNA